MSVLFCQVWSRNRVPTEGSGGPEAALQHGRFYLFLSQTTTQAEGLGHCLGGQNSCISRLEAEHGPDPVHLSKTVRTAEKLEFSLPQGQNLRIWIFTVIEGITNKLAGRDGRLAAGDTSQ